MTAGLPACRRAALVLAIFLVAGCASVTRPGAPLGSGSNSWQGRLSVKVLSQPVRAFAADFALQGNAGEGLLTLSSPLGVTLARMRWSAGVAVLEGSGEPQQFASMDELARATTGVDLPIAPLFDWLQGIATPALGWEPDLSGLPDGRLSARLTGRAPQAELKIVLDR